MSFDEDDSGYESDNFSVYSDTDLDCGELGDRYADENYKQMEADKIDDELAQVDDKRKYKYSLLENPDNMKVINRARVMPSVEEMNACFYALLDAESEASSRALAVPIIENWWKICLAIKADLSAKKMMEWNRIELASWKAARSSCRGVRQLGPVTVFETEYQLMADTKLKHSLIRAGILSRVQTLAARARAVIDAEKAQIRYRKAGKARAVAKKGMNKNTAWHKARVSNSLAIHETAITYSEPGEGKRAQRKKRQAKERLDSAKLMTDIPKSASIVTFVLDDTDDDRTDEQKALEQEEFDEAMQRMSRICVEKVGQRVAREEAELAEKKASADLKAKEEAELAEFVMVMTKNKKKKKITIEVGFKTLKSQKIEERRATDKKFDARCGGFEDLGSKEKLAEVLKFTSLCRSVTTKKKCYHPNCRFAHSIEQLQQKDCRFGQGCRFVNQMANGQYENTKFGRTGKTCSCMHIGEHKRGFCKRMGLEYKEVKSEKIQGAVVPVSPVRKTRWSAPVSTDVPSVWANVVTKAETAEKVLDCKSKMTKSWSAVVVETLTEERKAAIYGKGVELLGVVSEERESTPIIPDVIRKPWDKRGLGFTKPIQKRCTKVLQSGFNWVKGVVLMPPARVRKQRWDVVDPVMAKVMAAVQAINQRVAEINQTDLMRRVHKAKANEVEITKQVVTAEETDLMRRVRKAKAKAVEITKRVVTAEEKTWVKVHRRRSAHQEAKETEVTVLRVPRADAELALLGAIRNGLTNFRIVYTDEKTMIPSRLHTRSR
jgi:hypothetical protein